MIDPYTAYTLYTAVRLHFTSSYDYFKYGGKVSRLNTVGARQTFYGNKQRYFYGVLGRHEDPLSLIVANLLKNPKMFVVEVVSDAGYNNYEELKKRLSRLSYNFQQEISSFTTPQELTALSKSDVPVLLERFIAGKASAETLVIVDSFSKCFDQWAALKHPLVKREVMKLQKYRGFVVFPHSKCKQILLETLNTHTTL